ncbi:MAG: TIGR00296 family protein [archaeon]
MLTLLQGKILCEFARDSIISSFLRKSPEFDKVKEFSANQGVFITLHKNGELRGCIGYPEPVLPLNKAIMQAARAAAFEDPRFNPVSKEELDEIIIEISVLTVPQLIEVTMPIEYPKKIEIGIDGLIIRKAFYSGLLLPQVFTEYNSTTVEALNMTCQKAGLAQNAWKDKSCNIYKFQAQIFCEESPHGKVVEKK